MRRRLREESGITMVEVMIAVVVLLGGIAVFVSVIPSSARLSQTATRSEQASAAAERELERIRGLPFSQIGLAALPSQEPNPLGTSSNPRSPSYWLNGNRYRIANNWTDAASGTMTGTPAAGEVLWTSGGTLASTGTLVVDGQTADVFRYVTEREESCPLTAGPLLDPLITFLTPTLGVVISNLNDQIRAILDNRIKARLDLFCLDNTAAHADTKRVIVAVRMRTTGNAAGTNRPIYMTTIVTDKTRGVVTP